ncbi:MAG TPA: helix-turn-helix domain-containing protein [Syntrophomonas sp.]|nr:helix-turn-helix domain-containing protein [Syntrophomonas sp.]
MDTVKIGAFIAELRKQKGYTQKELAGKLAVTDKAVSRWETGKGLPDTSLLKSLSDILGVSVSELLSGERIESESRDEKTDKVIIDVMNYSKQMLKNMATGLLVAIGVFLLISPMFIAGNSYLYILGAVPIIFAAAIRVTVIRYGTDQQAGKIMEYAGAIFCQITALAFEILPYGVVLHFAPGPGETIVKTYSYFSLTPFGYANFFPLLTGILTVAAVLLSVITLIKKFKTVRLRNAAFKCTFIGFIFSFMPRVSLGAEYMNHISLLVTSLLICSAILQTAVNSKDNL